MAEKNILHVKIGAVNQSVVDDEEVERVRDLLREAFEDWGVEDEYEAFVTGPEVEIENVTEEVEELIEGEA